MADEIKLVRRRKTDRLKLTKPDPEQADPAKSEGVVVMDDGTEMLLVNKRKLSAIRKLGIDLDELGALEIANGFCILSKMTLAAAFDRMTAAMEIAQTPEIVISAARSLGYLTNSMAKLIGESRQLNAMRKAPQGPRNKSFMPGQAVAVQVNIQNRIQGKGDGKSD